MIELEQQILLLEQQVQGLSVSPGDFDTDNEFVTVNLRLAESKVAKRATKILISHTIDALAWTVLYYTLFWIGLAAFFGCCVPALVRETHQGDRCQIRPGSVAPIDRQAR